MGRKWWKNSRTKQALAIRATRRRLRASYHRQVRIEVADIAEQLHRAYDGKARAERDRASLGIREAEDKLAKVSAEVLRLRLEYGPDDWGSRYTLFATMRQSFIERTHNLKEIAGYIIENLSHRLRAEFAQVDFSRVKPVRFDPDLKGNRDRFPVWEIKP
jgi:hypothetical protein